MTGVERVLAHARRLGVDVQHVPSVRDESSRLERITVAPFIDGWATEWETKTLLYDDNGLRRVEDAVGAAIHELGHLVACRVHPYESDELSFFGWEWLTARKLNLWRRWFEDQSDYALEMRLCGRRVGDLCECDDAQLRELKKLVFHLGAEAGNVVDGKPAVVR